MATTLTFAAIAFYVVILAASLSTPLLGSVEPKSPMSRFMQLLLWVGLTLVVIELGALMTVGVVRVVRIPGTTGPEALRIGLLTFVFTAHAIWLFFGLGTLRVPESAVRGPGTLLLGLSTLFAMVCFACTVFLALRAGTAVDAWATTIAVLIGLLGLVPLFLFGVLVIRERSSIQGRRPKKTDGGPSPADGLGPH